jgi:hypothetical protein
MQEASDRVGRHIDPANDLDQRALLSLERLLKNGSELSGFSYGRLQRVINAETKKRIALQPAY